jgi:hypothetical protein
MSGFLTFVAFRHFKAVKRGRRLSIAIWRAVGCSLLRRLN